jgi:hypothetical protein
VRQWGSAGQREELGDALSKRQLLPAGDSLGLTPAGPRDAAQATQALRDHWTPLRQQTQGRWISLEDPNSPMRHLIDAVHTAALLRPDPRFGSAGSGFSGIDFSTERRINRRLESLDLMLESHFFFLRDSFGSEVGAAEWRRRILPIMRGRPTGAILATRPTSGSGSTPERAREEIPLLLDANREHGGYPDSLLMLASRYVQFGDFPAYLGVIRSYEHRTAGAPVAQLNVARTLTSIGARQ